jgi:hypothetical protein
MSLASINLLDDLHIVEGLAPVVPSSSTPDYISLKGANAAGILIHAKNATTVTGSAITLKQATAVAGTGEKALSFTTYYKKEDTGAADAPWTKATATSDTFTTLATDSKNTFYFIPIDPASLDINNGFDCVRAGTGNATAATISVYYLIRPKHNGNPELVKSFIVD